MSPERYATWLTPYQFAYFAPKKGKMPKLTFSSPPQF
jgi:hypothetical protein